MNPPKQGEIDWPERIYYVCNSGSGIVVNATPLVQAGTDRIAGMRVLCGVRDPKKVTPPEQHQSIAPAERLEAFAREIGIRAIDDRMHADPDLYAAWIGSLNASAARAKELNATLVYNVTGGPRTAPLAALLGTTNMSRSSIVAIAVSFSDRTCRQLVFDDDGVLTAEHQLPSYARIGFDRLIPLYGYREQDPGSRRDHEEFICKHREVAERVLKETKSGGKAAVAALHWSMHFDSGGRPRIKPFAPFRVDFDEIAKRPYAREPLKRVGPLTRVIEAFQCLDGLEIVRARGRKIERIYVKTEQACRFAGGVWLEAVVFGLVRDVFEDILGAEVVANATLAVAGTPPRSSNVLPDDREIDVAVVVDDQLHVIEVKAVNNSRGFGKQINKVAILRQELGSQVMRAFLVAPLLVKSDLENSSASFIKRAVKQGVRLYFDLPKDKQPGALERLKGELEKLAHRA